MILGKERVRGFSWEKCAKETLNIIISNIKNTNIKY